MSHSRHEIPTHLDVEDRAFYGLTIRQVMYLTVGGSCAYALWTQWPALPLVLRGAMVAPIVILALVFALVRPAGRGLDEWAFVALHHLGTPKVSTWRPREPDLSAWDMPGSEWEELKPQLAWREGRR
ncbi:MAG: PrgI family protein [Chloroflexi bacterium]|nr:PrgI family protein [Chloroflexota bacterium]